MPCVERKESRMRLVGALDLNLSCQEAQEMKEHGKEQEGCNWASPEYTKCQGQMTQDPQEIKWVGTYRLEKTLGDVSNVGGIWI